MKILTKEGENLLEILIKSYTELMNNQDIPFNALVLGFPQLTIQNREEIFQRIKLLKELINYDKVK